MSIFEYKIVPTGEHTDVSDLTEAHIKLREYGQDGWELVAVQGHGPCVLFLKRAK